MTKIKIKQGDKANLPTLDTAELACVDDKKELWMGTSGGNVHVGGGGSLSTLIGEYHFDEDSGTTAYDTSGYGYDGTLINSPSRVTGKYGKALQFDETNKYVNCATTSGIDFSGAFSIAFWFKTTMGGASNPGTIISKIDNIPSGKGWAFLLYDHEPGCLSLFVQENASNYKGWATTALYNDGLWHHAVGVKYADNTIKIYVDGEETAGHYVEAGTVTDYSNSETIKIGAEGVITHTFAGAIDEVHIYKRVLYAAEIANLYEFGDYLIIGQYPSYGDYGIIRNKLDTSATAIWGGNDDKGAGIYLWGKNHAGYAGDIEFVVPNAAGTILQTILRLEGKTDTPYLNAYKPLHIDDITEKTSGHGVALDCDLDMGNTHLLGHDIKNAQWIYGPSGDNGFVAIVGGISNTNSAAVIAYGPDFAGANGAIYMAVPNAAKNAVLDVIDITGATDSPVVNFHYPLNIDTINEYTAGAGVTIDGCLIKDSVLNILDSSIERQGDNNGLALVGGADVASIITLYGKNAGYHPGGIDFEVTNAAKNDITIAMEILGNTDTPSVDIQHALKTDTIDEISEGAGVTIDGVLLKDGTLTFMDLYVDHIGEKTADAGVSIEQVLCKDGTLSVPSFIWANYLYEKTVDQGVIIEGVLLKDGDLDMGNTHLLGHDIKNAQWIYGPSGDNGFVAIVGGISNTNSAAVIAYGPDFAGANGAIYMAVPNAAKNAVLDVIDITGATDSPVVNFHYPLNIDTINEYTAGAGVTIDGLVCKDHYLWLTNDTSELRIKGGTHVDASPHIYMLGKDIGYGDPGSIGFATTNIAGDDTELMLTLSGRDVNPLIRAYEKIQADVGIATNTIAERTTGYGVTIEELIIGSYPGYGDYGIIRNKLDTTATAIWGGNDDKGAGIYLWGKNHPGYAGDIEFVVPNGAGTLLKTVLRIEGKTDNPYLNGYYPLHIDTINEKTTDAGVTIDGCLIKDGVAASPVAATIIVAASNSLHKERADYTCSGANDDATINTAISALPANGGTIILLDGLYVIEDVILITKSNVTLKGMGCGATILETPSSLPAKIEAIIKAETKNYIYIQSMTISGGSAYKTNTGILFNTVSKSKVSDCGFEYSANVHLFSSTNRVLVTNNDFVVSAQLNLYNATYNTIKDNHSRMIHMDHSNYNLIENNIGYQIYLYYSDKNVITHNHTGSTAADIELQYSSSNIITNNILSGQHSIIIRLSSRYNKIDNNQCTPTYRAIYIYDQSYYNTVTNNHVTGGSHYGIYMKGASYCIIANNICCGWGSRGIMIEGGDYSVIKGNICKDNGTDGIILYNHADNNIVSNNQCSGNIDVGIMLEENNDDNTIIGNHCYNNDKDGILLFQSSHNIVEGNFCKDNGQDTLYSYSEIRIWGYSGVGSHHNLITNNKCRCTAATKCDYCIKEDLSIDDYNKITDNCVDGATTAQILTVGTHTVVHDNMGHNGVMDYGTF